MSYKTKINTLITEIVMDECKDKPEIQHFLEMAIEQEMISLSRSRSKKDISRAYEEIVKKCVEVQK